LGRSRDAFRQSLLDPDTADETVDQLRRAAKGIVNARTHAELSAAGENLAEAAQAIRVDRWPRFLSDAQQRGVAAVSDGAIPGVIKASAAGTDAAVGAVSLGLVLLLMTLQNQSFGPARSSIVLSRPAVVSQVAPKDDKAEPNSAAPPAGAGQDLSPGPGGVVISDDRRKHILAAIIHEPEAAPG